MAKFPFYKQTEFKDCGPTCLKIITSYYQVVIPIDVFRKRIETLFSQLCDQFMKEELVPEKLMYGNEFFTNYDDPTKEQRTTFIRIAPVNKEKGKVKVGKNNLFTAKCTDR